MGRRIQSDPDPTLATAPTSKLPSKRYAKILSATPAQRKRTVPIGGLMAHGGKATKLSNEAGKD